MLSQHLFDDALCQWNRSSERFVGKTNLIIQGNKKSENRPNTDRLYPTYLQGSCAFAPQEVCYAQGQVIRAQAAHWDTYMDGESAYRKAFETRVYEPHKDTVFRLALRKTGNPELAEEVVQEVFVRAFQGLAGLSDPGRVGEWLSRIAGNVVADIYRERSVHARHEAHIRQAKGARPPDRSAVLREVLLSEVDQLPENLREPFLLFYENNLSSDEIGRRLDIAEGTARWRVSEARKALRDRLQRRSQDVPELAGLAD